MEESVKTINGPINIARLEGKVGNVNKIIYLFMDYHISVERQTQCESLASIDAHQYLEQSFNRIKNTDRVIDFFPEAHDIELELMPNVVKGRYIDNVTKLGQKYFNNKSKNVRTHYFDIRNYSMLNLIGDTNNLLSMLGKYITYAFLYPYDINQLKKTLDFIHSDSIILLNIFKEGNINKILKTANVKQINLFGKVKSNQIDRIIKFINKIRSKYENDDVKKNLQIHINKLQDEVLETIKINNEIVAYIKKNMDTLVVDPNKLKKHDIGGEYGYYPNMTTMQDHIFNLIVIARKLDKKIINIHHKLVDNIAMRRVLDKKYINTSIFYTGLFHSLYYINILVKKFGFKITHISFSSVKDMNKLNERIKKQKKYEDLSPIIHPNKLYQCSDISTFPNNFA